MPDRCALQKGGGWVKLSTIGSEFSSGPRWQGSFSMPVTGHVFLILPEIECLLAAKKLFHNERYQNDLYKLMPGVCIQNRSAY